MIGVTDEADTPAAGSQADASTGSSASAEEDSEGSFTDGSQSGDEVCRVVGAGVARTSCSQGTC